VFRRQLFAHEISLGSSVAKVIVRLLAETGEGSAMKFEISFPDQLAAEAGVLAQELRLALLRGGADPSKIEIKKDRADTMDLGSVVQVALDAYHTSGPMLEHVMPALTAIHCARVLYEICAPAHSGIRVKTPRGTVELSGREVSLERLKELLEVADSDEHGG
jgi:hypothetical protein